MIRKKPDPTIHDREALRADLEVVRRSNNLWFAVCLALLSILFIATLWAVIAYLGYPREVRATIAALAGSTIAFVTVMVRLWQYKCSAEYLVTLAAHLDPATMKSVIQVFTKHV
jgi:hypothetical protein